MSRSYIVIPARLASTRLPRKILLRETGQSLLEHTYRQARLARRPSGVLVATDDEEIAAEVRRFGGQPLMTSPACACGTDRVAEAARGLPDADILINVQGDEPEIAASSIDRVAELLEQNPTAAMATLATPIRTRAQLDNPACVKVAFDAQGQALYFSRSAIPHPRQWHDDYLTRSPAIFHQHLGIYAYRRDFLLQLAQLPQTPFEQIESLEQLRVLESGGRILVGVVDEVSTGIDTPDDYRAFVARTLAARRKAG